jgi:hypothetical protein
VPKRFAQAEQAVWPVVQSEPYDPYRRQRAGTAHRALRCTFVLQQEGRQS